MKIKMLETRRGSEDGFIVKRFEKGQEYEVADALAQTFLREGHAHLSAHTAQVVDPRGNILGNLDRLSADFNRLFRPQPTRGSAPTNPSTLDATGKL
jgi:hypothetical protein